MKFQLGFQSLPRLTIQPSPSSKGNTGGICGFWDEDETKEFFVLDPNGAKKFLDSSSDDKFVSSIRDFWRFFYI